MKTILLYLAFLGFVNLGFHSALAQAPPVAMVKVESGVPQLYVHGRRTPPLMFWTPQPLGIERMRSFARQGVHIFSFDVQTKDWWLGPKTYEFGQLAKQLETVRGADPECLLLLRTDINPPGWWLKQHPEEQMVVLTQDGRSLRPPFAAMGSALWRQEAGEALEKLIAHFRRSPLAQNILGWHLAAGDCGEWAYYWGEGCSDYSLAQIRAFRQWLEQRYRTVNALAKAWNRPGATFDNAEMPPPARRYMGAIGELFDPAENRDSIDYLQFHSETVADAIAHFARISRRASENQHLIGVFYGYSLSPGWKPAQWHSTGHHALRQVLDCPEVDFIAAPYNYRDRYPGQACVPQTLPEAVRQAGKLYLMEDDTRTFLVQDQGREQFGRCRDLASTLGVLRRNWAAAATQGGGLWWMEQQPGWFEHPDLMTEIGVLRRLHASLPPEAFRPKAEIAVIVSQHAQSYMAQTSNLFIPLITAQVAQELAHIGAPFDLLLSSDLPQMRDYKLYIFPCAYYLPESERKAVDALYQKGHTVVWTHAPGLLSERRVDTAAASALAGMELGLARIGGPVRIRITDIENPLTRGLPAASGYGSDFRIAPLMEVLDREAVVLGYASATSLETADRMEWPLPSYYRPGLAVKTFRGAKVVFSAAGPLPAPLLRNIAQQAGVHIYCQSGDVVYASHGILAVHYASSGPRTLQLPPDTRALDFKSGKTVSNAMGQITTVARMGETDLFLLHQGPIF